MTLLRIDQRALIYLNVVLDWILLVFLVLLCVLSRVDFDDGASHVLMTRERSSTMRINQMLTGAQQMYLMMNKLPLRAVGVDNDDSEITQTIQVCLGQLQSECLEG